MGTGWGQGSGCRWQPPLSPSGLGGFVPQFPRSQAGPEHRGSGVAQRWLCQEVALFGDMEATRGQHQLRVARGCEFLARALG